MSSDSFDEAAIAQQVEVKIQFSLPIYVAGEKKIALKLEASYFSVAHMAEFQDWQKETLKEFLRQWWNERGDSVKVGEEWVPKSEVKFSL